MRDAPSRVDVSDISLSANWRYYADAAAMPRRRTTPPCAPLCYAILLTRVAAADATPRAPPIRRYADISPLLPCHDAGC